MHRKHRLYLLPLIRSIPTGQPSPSPWYRTVKTITGPLISYGSPFLKRTVILQAERMPNGEPVLSESSQGPGHPPEASRSMSLPSLIRMHLIPDGLGQSREGLAEILPGYMTSMSMRGRTRQESIMPQLNKTAGRAMMYWLTGQLRQTIPGPSTRLRWNTLSLRRPLTWGWHRVRLHRQDRHRRTPAGQMLHRSPSMTSWMIMSAYSSESIPSMIRIPTLITVFRT